LSTNRDRHEAIFEEILRAQEQSGRAQPATSRPMNWSSIMKSPLPKLAAAAVIVIACVIGLSLWRTTGSGIALADVLARVEQVKAYRYQWFNGTREYPNKPYDFVRRATTLSSQEYGSKTTMEELTPMADERSRRLSFPR
jgi:hypothetical protein